MALCRELGPDRDAPVLCCVAEVLANIALRDGEDAATVYLVHFTQ